jgi:catecholate siderophore receptor
VRFGVIWRSDDRSAWYASYGTSFNTSGELCNCDAPGAKSPPEKSRSVEVGAKLDLFEGRLSARGALFHSTKTNERNLDSPSGQPIEDYLLSGRRHASGVDIDRPGRITRRWEAFGSCTWISSARIDEAAPNGTITGEQVGDRPSLTPRHSGSLSTTYQLTPELRLGAGLNARSAQTPNRNPAGIVAPGFASVDLLAEYAVTPAMALKLNIISATERPYADSLYRALHSGAAAHGIPVDRAGAR